MGAKKFRIIQQARTALLAFLKEDSPQTKCSFFKNVLNLRDLYANYVDEVGQNCLHLSNKKKKEFLQAEERAFGRFKFEYDTRYLDGVFSQFEEDPKSFPVIINTELVKVLSMDAKKIWHPDTSEEERRAILQHIKIQEECLLLFYHLKLTKIREFLMAMAIHEENSPKGLIQELELKDAMLPRREARREILQLLEEGLVYQGDGNNGLKPEPQLEAEKTLLIGRFGSLCVEAIEEIEHNVFLYSYEKAVEYLKLYSLELARRQTELEKYEFDLLNFQDPDLPEAGLSMQLRDRKDIGEALKLVNAHRLKISARLQQRLKERLQDYRELKMENKPGLRGEESTGKIINLLADINFFTLLPDVADGANTENAITLKTITGHSLQNLREELGKLSKKPSELTPYERSLRTWARERNDRTYKKRRK